MPENERMVLMDRKKELSQVCLEFSKNYNEEKVLQSFTMTFAHLSEVFQGVVSFTLKELEGVPADVVSGYTKRIEGPNEVYDVTFKTPDIFPVVRIASVLRTTYLNGASFSSNLLRILRRADAHTKAMKLDWKLMCHFSAKPLIFVAKLQNY